MNGTITFQVPFLLGFIASAAFGQVPADLRAAMMTRAERLAQFKAQKPIVFEPRTREQVVRYGKRTWRGISTVGRGPSSFGFERMAAGRQRLSR